MPTCTHDANMEPLRHWATCVILAHITVLKLVPRLDFLDYNQTVIIARKILYKGIQYRGTVTVPLHRFSLFCELIPL